jgi:hexosaminidase
MNRQLYWEARTTPVALRPMLAELGKYYPITKGQGAGLSLSFEPAQDKGRCEVITAGQTATVHYATPAQAARAIGAILSGLTSARTPYTEHTPFETLGIMLDCSRNAVMTVDQVQKWLRQLALLGYNTVMLYTEDTYELQGEPYFGYQRGAYSTAELKAIDRYGATLGIEIIPCIQTLGHLERILRHAAYHKVRDTSSVLLVGEKDTYALIEKMIAHWSQTCRTDRIHLGMDETHDLGRGRYMDQHGYRDGFELFNEHLAKVVKICDKHGLKPMIWSDMYFRLGSKNNEYYDPDTVIPNAVAKKIPQAVELVYWDYYHSDKAFYLDWIERHRQLGKEPLMGSGIWTWNRYWYDHQITVKNAGPCIDACYESKLKEVIFTMWGDNGAYCDHNSAFAGMVYCADRAYGHPEPSPTLLEKRFGMVCGGSYAAHILAGDLHGGAGLPPPNMWDDPIYETKFRTWAKDNPELMSQAASGFAGLARKLRRHAGHHETGNFSYAHATAQAFADRYKLSADLLRAYRRKDRKGLQSVRRRITKVSESAQAMEDAFRIMWMSHNKPEGIETIQGRFGMIQARYRELDRRLDEYLRGVISRIPELDGKCPPE